MNVHPRDAIGEKPLPVEHSPRTRLLLHGPIVPTLLRMAWPNILVMVAQSATGLIETWFVSKLGTDALAGMALVFPCVMLMQMISAGAMGGGISSAVARALGAGRPATFPIPFSAGAHESISLVRRDLPIRNHRSSRSLRFPINCSFAVSRCHWLLSPLRQPFATRHADGFSWAVPRRLDVSASTALGRGRSDRCPCSPTRCAYCRRGGLPDDASGREARRRSRCRGKRHERAA